MNRLNVTLDITRSCPLRCCHCNRNAGSPLFQELNLSEWKEIISRLLQEIQGGEMGLRISVQGGEPTMRDDFPAFLSFLRKGLGRPAIPPEEPSNIGCFLKSSRNILEVVTNGIHFSERQFELFAEVHPDIIRVSLDSAFPTTYELIHGGDFFYEVVDTIKKLLPISLIKLSFVLMRCNMSEAVSFLRLSQSLGIKYVRFAPLIPQGRGGFLYDQLLTIDEWSIIIRNIHNWQESKPRTPFVSISIPEQQWREIEKEGTTFNGMMNLSSDVLEVSPLNFGNHLVISPNGELFTSPISYYESTLDKKYNEYCGGYSIKR